MNYFVKVDVGDGEYVHLKIFQPLPYTNLPPELTDLESGKTASDPL